MSGVESTYYDRYWSDEGFRPEHQLWPELRAKYEQYLPSDGKVLDLGCGDGSTSGLWLTSQGFDYVGLDVSSTAVETATSRGLTARKIADGSATELESSSFDSVVCIEVLEHLFLPQHTLSEVLRVLRPGGTFIATTPNVAYWRSRLNLLLLGRFDPIGDNLSLAEPWRDPHIRFFTPQSLARLLESVGYEIVERGGHNGGFLNGLPWVPRLRQRQTQSRLYRWLEARWPKLFAYRTCVVARKPLSPRA